MDFIFIYLMCFKVHSWSESKEVIQKAKKEVYCRDGNDQEIDMRKWCADMKKSEFMPIIKVLHDIEYFYR